MASPNQIRQQAEHKEETAESEETGIEAAPSKGFIESIPGLGFIGKIEHKGLRTFVICVLIIFVLVFSICSITWTLDATSSDPIPTPTPTPTVVPTPRPTPTPTLVPTPTLLLHPPSSLLRMLDGTERYSAAMFLQEYWQCYIHHVKPEPTRWPTPVPNPEHTPTPRPTRPPVDPNNPTPVPTRPTRHFPPKYGLDYEDMERHAMSDIPGHAISWLEDRYEAGHCDVSAYEGIPGRSTWFTRNRDPGY